MRKTRQQKINASERLHAYSESQRKRRAATVYTFQPVGVDIWDRRANQPEPGQLVVKTQPYGCPRNGTMGHCFVADAASGEFLGLVLINSLQRVKGRK
jgi:hypothetical protein